MKYENFICIIYTALLSRALHAKKKKKKKWTGHLFSNKKASQKISGPPSIVQKEQALQVEKL